MLIKPENLNELLEIISKKDKKPIFLAGGTDINVLRKKGVIKDEDIIFINHLKDLAKISETDNLIKIGALTTYEDILASQIIKNYVPFIQNSLKSFASPLIQTMATIGGNIANGSPTNDVSPLLLVLDAKLILKSINEEREVCLKDFYKGYKKSELRNDEIIKEIVIKKDAQKDYVTYYNKVASRNILAISKLSLAAIKKVDDEKITEIKIAVGSLNEYPRRLFLLEDYLVNKSVHTIDFSIVRQLLQKEITPITDFRSDSEYRFEVCQNLIIEFLSL